MGVDVNLTRRYAIHDRFVTVPVEIRDASCGTAMFLVSAATAQSLLPGAAFQIVDVGGGRAQLILCTTRYRDTDLGHYDEIAIVLSVRPVDAAPEAAGPFRYQTLLNDPFARQAGDAIWGFPETAAEIACEERDDNLTGMAAADGQHILTLTLPRASRVPGPPAEPDVDSVAYTYLDRVPHRARFTTGAQGTVVTAGGGVDVTLGTHPVANALRALGLPTAPVIATWTEHMHRTWEPAERL